MSCIFMSCIFMPCYLVRHFHVLQFHVRHFQRPPREHWALQCRKRRIFFWNLLTYFQQNMRAHCSVLLLSCLDQLTQSEWFCRSNYSYVIACDHMRPDMTGRGRISLISEISQPYEGRLPLTSWWRKSSNMTVGQCSLIYLAHHCYDWHPGSRCG